MKKIIISILSLFFVLFGVVSAQAREISEVPHWQTSPIRVYVPSDDKKAPSMRRAFAKWQAKSFGKLKFRFVGKTPADITVVFTEAANGSTPISSTTVTYNGTKITKAEIHIATKSKDFKKYSNDYVYTAMLHEVGKAIGMPINSRKRTSIMFAPITVQQDIMKIDIMKLYSVYGWSYANKDIHNTNSKPTEEMLKPTSKKTTTPPVKNNEEKINSTDNNSAKNIEKPDLDELGK